MVVGSNKKNKIELTDYNYKRDIENRIFMAQLTFTEVDVLREIVNGSLKIPVASILEALNISETDLIPILDALKKTKLFTHDGKQIVVDKELRKYYENQIGKFDDDFLPGIEYFQGLLSKVPIHVLPIWYGISRVSENIFNSIIEKYLLTPKIYERYLVELDFDHLIMTGIIKDVFSSPDFTVYSHVLRDKYKLTFEEFEEYMLHLEFNFVCCLSYRPVNGMWKEVITPFYEWMEFLCFQRDTEPQPIKDKEKLLCDYKEDFGFVRDLTAVLKVLTQIPLKISMLGREPSLALESIASWLPHMTPEVAKHVFDKLEQLHLAEIREGYIHPTPKVREWLEMPPQEQAMMMYRQTTMNLSRKKCGFKLMTEKDVREAEKNLKRIVNVGWVYFDDFLRGFISPLGSAEPVVLRNRGKQWKYLLPVYSPEEHLLIESVIFERLSQVGMVATGTHNGKRCFCITSFGALIL